MFVVFLFSYFTVVLSHIWRYVSSWNSLRSSWWCILLDINFLLKWLFRFFFFVTLLVAAHSVWAPTTLDEFNENNFIVVYALLPKPQQNKLCKFHLQTQLKMELCLCYKFSGQASFLPTITQSQGSENKNFFFTLFPSKVWLWFVLFSLMTHWAWNFQESEIYVGISFWPTTNKTKYLDQQILTDATGHSPDSSLWLIHF